MSWTYQRIPTHSPGIKLRCALWKKSPQPEQYVVFVTGRGEWLEKYQSLAEELRLPDSTGFVIFDHRGQGGSDGPRSHIDDYFDFALDLQTVITVCCENKPFSIIAHSMGGLISLYAIGHDLLMPQKLLLSSAFLKFPNKPLPRSLALPISKTLTQLGLGQLRVYADVHKHIPFMINKLTNDRERYKICRKPPYPATGISFAWAYASLRAIAKIQTPEFIAKVSCKTAMIFGDDERVVDPAGFYEWSQTYSQVHAIELTQKKITHAKHELFFEAEVYRSQAIRFARELLGL